MLNNLCNQDKPGKNDHSSYFSEKVHYNKHPEYDKKRSSPVAKSPKHLN